MIKIRYHEFHDRVAITKLADDSRVPQTVQDLLEVQAVEHLDV